MSKKGQSPIKTFSSKRRRTYLRMLRSIVAAIFFVIVVLIVLQFLGINVSSMLAGVGIASIVVGFALQDALKDIIRGLEIVTDDYFEIGDVIKFGENTGEVLKIGLRTTKIRDMNSMNIVSIANRNLEKVEVVSEYIYLQVPLPYEIKPEAAERLMLEITKNIMKLKDVKLVEYQGLTQIGDSALMYQVAITCEPLDRLAVRRGALGIVTETLAEHKLGLPYKSVTMRAKK